MSDLNRLTIREAADGLRAKRFTSLELVEACLERMRSADGQVHAVLETLEASAREAAAASDARREAGASVGPLDGIPLMIKDNLQMKGSHT
ncbi:MAG TPA: amidase family protein, partial [Candidatus Baltobacteraceae bacterium]|nr:amidase family protein [Candidatus Baltobacteraceae bacterium]